MSYIFYCQRINFCIKNGKRSNTPFLISNKYFLTGVLSLIYFKTIKIILIRTWYNKSTKSMVYENENN